MNGRRAQVRIALATSEPRPRWCPECKAETAIAVDVYALFPTGLTYVTTVSLCELCDDPADQEDTPPCAT